ncbi:hypothetical protein ACFQ60_35915 [Streptomyces zhihengii]
MRDLRCGMVLCCRFSLETVVTESSGALPLLIVVGILVEEGLPSPFDQ